MLRRPAGRAGRRQDPAAGGESARRNCAAGGTWRAAPAIRTPPRGLPGRRTATKERTPALVSVPGSASAREQERRAAASNIPDSISYFVSPNGPTTGPRRAPAIAQASHNFMERRFTGGIGLGRPDVSHIATWGSRLGTTASVWAHRGQMTRTRLTRTDLPGDSNGGESSVTQTRISSEHGRRRPR